MNPTVKQVLHWAGSALAIVGIVFVIVKLRDDYLQLNVTLLARDVWLAVFGYSFIYGLTNFMLALAWFDLLRGLGINIRRLLAFKVYGLSQIAKYLPGNIFHLAGRQALGMAAGICGWVLAKSSALELGLISFTGALFGLLVLPLFFDLLSTPVCLGAFVVVNGISISFLYRYIDPSYAWAQIWYLVFLATTGMIFTALFFLISVSGSHETLPWISIIGAYVLAWLAGLITLGAPAGLGVRELALLFLLNGIVAESELLIAVLLGRLVTISGDVIFYLLSVLSRKTGTVNEKCI